jgi:signal transduction histidine kinase
MNITLYSKLSKIGFLSRSYTLKFLFIAFLGIHLPIIALVYFMFLTDIEITPNLALSIVLIMTLVGTAITLYILTGLLQPFKEAEKSLRKYSKDGTLPSFPLTYKDEVGSLFINLQSTLQKQDKLLKEKKDITILLSHDLRSPLNKCLSLVSLIRVEDDEAEKNTYLNLVENTLLQQLEFLEEILLMLESQDTSSDLLLKTTISTKDFVGKVIDGLKLKIDEKNIEVKTNFDTLDSINANEKLFYHAVHNILSNAIKFSHPNSVIQINVESNENDVILTIKDNGLGFDSTVGNELFNKFTSHGKPGTIGEKSTGLGLYITKQIIDKHQGNITAFSNGKNQGATFVISLPKA